MAMENNQQPEIEPLKNEENQNTVNSVTGNSVDAKKMPPANTTRTITMTKSVIREFIDLRKKMLSVVEMLIVAGLIVTSNLWLHNLGYLLSNLKDFSFGGLGDAVGTTILLIMISVFGLETRYSVIQKEKSKSEEESNTEIQDMLQVFLDSGIDKIKNEVVKALKKD